MMALAVLTAVHRVLWLRLGLRLGSLPVKAQHLHMGS